MDVYPEYKPLSAYPRPEEWDDWVEYESTAWPRKVEKHYFLVPTTCFNCEAACGLLAYVDKSTLEIRKFEGNPVHPASRGRNCAKGPATINQIQDPERILYPMKRKGARGSGEFERTTWDAVLDDIAGRIRLALLEDRRNEVVYHVGRPGHDGYADRNLQAWGVDGHNSHTNICSSSARLGYNLWQGYDRPSPDHARARFILLLSSHLETGHYFNPHAQRIIEAKMKGARIAAVDVRLSNTASQADYWISPWPGTEAAMLLAVARLLLLESDRVNHEFVRSWVNWREFLRSSTPQETPSYENFLVHLKRLYAEFTPEFAAAECGIDVHVVTRLADDIAGAGTAFASHVWRNAAAGNQGGWQVARCLEFLHVLTGSVGTEGGLIPNGWNKFVPEPFLKPSPQKLWNELLWPPEYPLAFHEMSFLLPHLLKEGRSKLAVYFTRVYNPVWTNPDGGTWMEVLQDETKIGLHCALTPIWSETALFADYVLPMGMAGERHDLQSQETHAGRWIAFRQPVLRVVKEKLGQKVEFTYQANPGEVWEEDEFWIELSWRIDPDGSLGVRKYFESPYRKGEKLSIDEYYRWMFENSVPGLPERAAREGLTPLEFMRKYGAYQVPGETTMLHHRALSPQEQDGAVAGEDGVLRRDGQAVGVEIDGRAVAGFPTPSRRLEFFSPTMRDWKWPEHALPGYIRSHVHPERLNRERNEFCLVPTFRLPTLIHTRSGNAKYLNEISHRNPVWIHAHDAVRLGVRNGELLRVTTAIGYFVNRAWVTEGIKPGLVACSHHLGRWTLFRDKGERWSAATVSLEREGTGWKMRQIEGLKPFASSDPDSGRIWWSDAGVHQNLTFPVQPDPISGMHCWHQKVTVTKAVAGDRYGDIFVDTAKSMEVFREWLAKTRPAPGPGNLRRPLWFPRPLKPAPTAYRMEGG